MKKTFYLSSVISLSVFLLLSPIFSRLTSYLHPIVLAVILFCICMLVFAILLGIRKERINLSTFLFHYIILGYSMALLILLFFRPNDQPYHSWNLIPFSTIAFFLSGKVNGLVAFYNLAANIGLFIPFGIFLMTGKKKSMASLFFVPLFAISGIEVMQLITHRGSLDIDDLILNLFGVYIGYWLDPQFKKVVNIHKKN